MIKSINYYSFEVNMHLMINAVVPTPDLVGKSLSTIDIKSVRTDAESFICSIAVYIESYTDTHIGMYKMTTRFNVDGGSNVKAPIPPNEYPAYAQLVMLAEFNATSSFIEYARGTELRDKKFRLRTLSEIISDVQKGVISINN